MQRELSGIYATVLGRFCWRSLVILAPDINTKDCSSNNGFDGTYHESGHETNGFCHEISLPIMNIDFDHFYKTSDATV